MRHALIAMVSNRQRDLPDWRGAIRVFALIIRRVAAASFEFSSALGVSDWRGRRPPFGELRRFDDGRPIVVMELTPDEPDRAEAWSALRTCWLELLPHHHILDAIEEDDRTLLLRYAAIDWRSAPVRGDSPTGRKMIATWGRQLVDAYTLIASQFRGAAAHFMRPLLTFDITNRLRVGFLPTTEREPWIPHEVSRSWPASDEPALGYAIAYALRDLCLGWTETTAEPIKSILERALDPTPQYRYPSLASLRAAFDDLAYAPLDEKREAALYATEEGIGWLYLGEPKPATPKFLAALSFCPELLAAKEGLARCHALRKLGETPHPVRTDQLAMARAYEDHGQLLAAVHRYERAATELADSPARAAAWAGIARSRLALGHTADALDAALATLALDPHHGEASSIGARAALALRRYDEAIHLIERRLAADDLDASAHYMHGRALLMRKRFVEARDAFDRACTLDPSRVEAMLLRREADRSVRRLASAVGVARPMTVDLPEHLLDLRDPLAAGRVDEVIPNLELRVDDAAAQLVLAECLAYAARYDEAIVVYRRVIALDPSLRARATINYARALVFLERAEEAFAALAGFEGKEANELRAMLRERIGGP